jgi:hypothetical protein
MSIESNEHQGHSSKIRRWVVDRGVRIGVGVMVLCVVLAHLHVIDEKYVYFPLTALILLLSEQLHESAGRLKQEVESIKTDARQQIKTLIESTSFKLLGLKECVTDLDTALDSTLHVEPVRIEHIGLDMAQAWVYVEPFLRSHPHLIEIDYKLAILTDDVGKLGDVDEEVKNWAHNVTWSLERIKRDITHLLTDPTQQHRKIRFEVRKYTSTPVVHGFRITGPVERCYVAICRWGGMDYRRYEWGEPQYHRSAGEAPMPTDQDMVRIFQGYFGHFWQTGEVAFLLESTPKLAPPKT